MCISHEIFGGHTSKFLPLSKCYRFMDESEELLQHFSLSVFRF